ncbi:MAG TPA: AraC family ligand binding domain-containing protein, partial [Povalibacter sp.]
MTKVVKRSAAKSQSTEPAFWRDDALPFVEARAIEDGSHISYARHAHDTFSIGAVTRGQSTYVNGKARECIGAGSVVVMNPGDTHACNPIGHEPWGYRMLYVDAEWLAGIQAGLGAGQGDDFLPFATTWTVQPALYASVNRIYELLTDPLTTHFEKQSAAVTFAMAAQQSLSPARNSRGIERRSVSRA